jgi:tRNA threonylcarbamoyladenosine biosynthesis protein TsaB
LMAPVGPERVSKPSEVQLPQSWQGTPVHAAGRGFAAYGELGRNLVNALARVDSTLLPAAREIALLAVPEVCAGRTVAPEDAVPVYLRDDVARPKPR